MATLVTLQATPLQLDSSQLAAKEKKLFDVLHGLGRVIVAYSGGTDSAYLAWAAQKVPRR